jgi:hypothetical protein
MIFGMSIETEAPASRGLSGFPWKPVVGVVVALALLGLGFAAGAHRSPHVMELSGTAHVGDRFAMVTVNGWAYGIPEDVAWIDAEGSLHDKGWPDCLGSEGDEFIRFAAVGVHYPDKTYERQVLYVDCRP